MQHVGFEGDHLVAASFTLNHTHYRRAEQSQAFFDALEARLSRIPGITSFALSDTIPPAGGMHGRPLANMLVAGHAPFDQNGGMVAFRYVTPSYFHTLRIPVVRGRVFTESERNEAESTIVLSETLSRRLFGSADPIAQRISLDQQHWLTVIGVVADVKNSGLGASAEPEYYRLRTRRSDQLGHSAVALFRTDLNPATLERWIRREIEALDSTLPVEVVNVPERIRHLTDQPRFLVLVIGFFAATSLLLTAGGLHSIIAFLVEQRTREIGVRVALGATRHHIFVLVQRQTMLWTLVGVILGVAAAIALGRFIRGLLFEISPADPLTLSAAALGLLFIAALGAWRPARHATRIDPAQSLRV